MSGLRIPKKKAMSMKRKLNVYLKPKIIYIPLGRRKDEEVNIFVKNNDYVFKGSVIARTKTGFKMPIFSSVSGTVLGIKERTNGQDITIKCIAIENDFKEQIEVKKVINHKMNDFSKSDFIERLKECGIVGMGGAGFPTHVKYNTENKVSTLIINAVECEPYISSDHFIVSEKCEDILETIDAIMTINNIDRCIIAIKKTNTTLIDLIARYIGTYLKIKIKLVPNVYPMGWERTLVKHLCNEEYDKIPIEKGIIVNNISTIYAINQALKLDKPLIERIVTFSGEGLNQPQNVLVKIGTPVLEVIEHIGGTKENIDIIAGGPMMGELVDSDLIITAEVNCILALNKIKTERPIECLRCGKCINVCPSNLCPVLIKDNISNIKELTKMNADKCVACGLCSFVCPSKINVREFVKAAKKKNRRKGDAI